MILSTINDFGPFQAEVWGTVSDWAIVIVTGLTARFIYLTFRSQLQVTKSQIRLQEIESNRYRKEIMPRFELTNKKRPYTFPALRAGYFIQELCLKLNDNPLVDFALKVTEITGFKIYNENTPDPLVVDTMNSKWVLCLQFTFESDDAILPKRDMGQPHIIFEVTFKDLTGNSYKQMLLYVPEVKQQCFTNEPILEKSPKK